MRVYTYSEAKRNLAKVLDEAKATGKVLIRQRNGNIFAIVPKDTAKSALDVPPIKADITTEEIISAIREGRERSYEIAKRRR